MSNALSVKAAVLPFPTPEQKKTGRKRKSGLNNNREGKEKEAFGDVQTPDQVYCVALLSMPA